MKRFCTLVVALLFFLKFFTFCTVFLSLCPEKQAFLSPLRSVLLRSYRISSPYRNSLSVVYLVREGPLGAPGTRLHPHARPRLIRERAQWVQDGHWHALLFCLEPPAPALLREPNQQRRFVMKFFNKNFECLVGDLAMSAGFLPQPSDCFTESQTQYILI